MKTKPAAKISISKFTPTIPRTLWELVKKQAAKQVPRVSATAYLEHVIKTGLDALG